VTLPNGTTYSRIEAGGSLCVKVVVLVPEALEDGARLTFEGVVDRIYHRYGSGVQLIAGGLKGVWIPG